MIINDDNEYNEDNELLLIQDFTKYYKIKNTIK